MRLRDVKYAGRRQRALRGAPAARRGKACVSSRTCLPSTRGLLLGVDQRLAQHHFAAAITTAYCALSTRCSSLSISLPAPPAHICLYVPVAGTLWTADMKEEVLCFSLSPALVRAFLTGTSWAVSAFLHQKSISNLLSTTFSPLT